MGITLGAKYYRHQLTQEFILDHKYTLHTMRLTGTVNPIHTHTHRE